MRLVGVLLKSFPAENFVVFGEFSFRFSVFLSKVSTPQFQVNHAVPFCAPFYTAAESERKMIGVRANGWYGKYV